MEHRKLTIGVRGSLKTDFELERTRVVLVFLTFLKPKLTVKRGVQTPWPLLYLPLGGQVKGRDMPVRTGVKK